MKMTQEFCEHLDEYGVAFGRAKASYDSCLNIIEKIITDPGTKELRTTLENSLDEWVLETRNLRILFKKMEKNCEIELVENSDQDQGNSLNPHVAICCDCGFEIPRLVFSEFDLSNVGGPTYRGQTLPLPAGAGV